jgi:hypothetical protein
MKTKIIFSIFIFSLLSPLSVFAQTTSTPDTAISSNLVAPRIPEIISEIKQAKMNLATVKLNYALDPVYKKAKATKSNPKPKSTLTGYNLSAKDIALAILDPATKEIIIVKGMQKGKTMQFNDPAADVTLSKFNGVNSKFSINRPANGKVIALKYLITGPESGSKASIENAMDEAIYVPYSSSLYTPEVAQYGADYLDGIINSVSRELSVLPSKADTTKKITEAIPPRLIKALVYAEHMDTTQFLYTPTQDMINQVNVLFATNEGDTFKYSGSSAGALGISQFIPSTYASTVSRHPEANLIPNFVAGMSNHTNAIKATFLLIDDYVADVRNKTQFTSFAQGSLFDYGAAAYNGGTGRVAKAITQFGIAWDQDHSSEINSLQSQLNTISSQVKSLKAKVKAAKDKKTKATYQAQLNTANSALAETTGKLTTMQAANLRNETVNYLVKIQKLSQTLNTHELASATP